MTAEGVTFTASLLNPASNLNAIVLLIGVVSVLFYFFFSVEHTGVGKAVEQTSPVLRALPLPAKVSMRVPSR